MLCQNKKKNFKLLLKNKICPDGYYEEFFVMCVVDEIYDNILSGRYKIRIESHALEQLVEVQR